MVCLKCGKQLVNGCACSYCGYAIKTGDSIASLFELNIAEVNLVIRKPDPLKLLCNGQVQGFISR
jgi:hypothetical protein